MKNYILYSVQCTLYSTVHCTVYICIFITLRIPNAGIMALTWTPVTICSNAAPSAHEQSRLVCKTLPYIILCPEALHYSPYSFS